MNRLTFLVPPGDRRILLAWFLLCLASLALLWSVTEPIRGDYNPVDPVVAKTMAALRDAKPEVIAAAQRPGTKQAQLIAMLQEQEGVESHVAYVGTGSPRFYLQIDFCRLRLSHV